MEQRGDLIPVVLITSDPEWEKGIREFLINSGRVHLVRVFASPDQAVQLLPHVRPSPEIVLLTENAGGVPELSTCRQISQMMPQAAVILVVSDTLFDDPRYLRSAMASGADDVLRMTRPMRFQGWIESMERVRDLLRARTVATRRETGRVVAVFSLKGGVGKTTLALGLADRLAAAPPEPSRVVYVDLNWHAGMTETLVGHPASRSWLESLDFQQWSPAIVDALITRAREALRFDFLAAPREEDHYGMLRDLFLLHRLPPEEAPELDRLARLLSDGRAVEDEILQDVNRRCVQHARIEHALATALHHLLINLRAYYRYVVLDLPPSADFLTLLALQRADRIVLVLTPDLAALRATHLGLDLLQRSAIPGEIGVVLNRATRRSEIRPDTLQRLLRGISWLAAVPEDPWMAWDRSPADVLRRPGLLEAIGRMVDYMFPSTPPGEEASRRRSMGASGSRAAEVRS